MKGSSVANPMDFAEMGRDLLRRDECMLLFDRLSKEKKLSLKGIRNEYTNGYEDALQMAMDYLDGRIGSLRDRWNDSGII